MLQIVLSMIMGAMIALGTVWVVRNKERLRTILCKYVYWIVGVCIASLFGILLGVLINCKAEELGSWADWMSGIATSLALIFTYAEIRNSREQIVKSINLN